MKKKVLFLCTNNSARSQMAEGLMRDLFGDRFDVHSAGTEPTEPNPHAVKVLAEIGIDISRARSKSVNEFSEMKFDYVITLCDSARESCPVLPGSNIHMSFRDPGGFEGTEDEKIASFRKVRDEIKAWLMNAKEFNESNGPQSGSLIIG